MIYYTCHQLRKVSRSTLIDSYSTIFPTSIPNNSLSPEKRKKKQSSVRRGQMVDVRTEEESVFHFTLTELELHSVFCVKTTLSLSLSWPINIPCSPAPPGHLVFGLSWPYLQTACLQEGRLFSELAGGTSQQWSKEHDSVQRWMSVQSYSTVFLCSFFPYISFLCGV